MRNIKFSTALLLTVFSVTACAANIALSNAWIRYLSSGIPAGGYFILINKSSQPMTLIGAQSPVFGMIMMHQTKEDNGVSKMVPVDKVEIPSGGKIEFKPGGYHLMLMDPTGPITVGEKIPLTLRFSGGQKLNGEFAVRAANVPSH